jgi:hypothetical protein
MSRLRIGSHSERYTYVRCLHFLVVFNSRGTVSRCGFVVSCEVANHKPFLKRCPLVGHTG